MVTVATTHFRFEESKTGGNLACGTWSRMRAENREAPAAGSTAAGRAMDPDSSTFCINYLSQFPSIKAETISTLCFNGFTNYHQLVQLDNAGRDVPAIREISAEQRVAVHQALVWFTSTGRGVQGDKPGGGQQWPALAEAVGASSGSVEHSNGGAPQCYPHHRDSIVADSCSLYRHHRSGRLTPNSFDQSDAQVAATVLDDGSRRGTIACNQATVNDAEWTSVNICNKSSGRTKSTPVSTVSASWLVATNFVDTLATTAAGSGAATSADSLSTTSVAPPLRQPLSQPGPSGAAILLAGTGNSTASSTSSIYQRIDQSDLLNNHSGGRSSSKLGETSKHCNFVLVTASDGAAASRSKRRKQNSSETVTVLALSPPSSAASAPASSQPTTTTATGLTSTGASSTQCGASPGLVLTPTSDLQKRPSDSRTCDLANVNRTNTGPYQPTASSSQFQQSSGCIVFATSTGKHHRVQYSSSDQPRTVKNEESALNSVSRMPYAIFEQLDCAKKLENDQKSLLYHFGNQETSDSKKGLIENSGCALAGGNGQSGATAASVAPGTGPVGGQADGGPGDVTNYLLTGSTTKLNASSPPSYDSSNINFILNSTSYSSPNESKSVTVSSINSNTTNSGTVSNLVTVPADSTILSNVHLNNNVVVSSADSAIQSSLQSIASTTDSSALSDSLQIRDFLSEINVQQVPHNGTEATGSGAPGTNGNVISSTSGSHTSTVVALSNVVDNNSGVLTNSTNLSNFLTPSNESHGLEVKNGAILIDSVTGQPIDPSLNNYLYSTLQLQLATTAEVNKTPIAATAVDPNKSIFAISASPNLGTTGIQSTTTALQPQQVTTSQSQSQGSSSSSSSRRGRGRPKKYSDPLSLAVEQCLENSNSPTQPSSVGNAVTQFNSGLISTTTAGTVHHCRVQGCNFSSADILEFRNHNRAQHRDESTIIPSRKGKASAPKEPLICEVPGCGYSPKYRRLLIDHQNAHKGLRAHKCCFCEYNSSYFGDIRKHMIKKHPDLAAEIKLSKLKLKQNGLDSKSSKMSKRELDELSHKMATEAVKAKKAAAGLDPNSQGQTNGTGKKRNYTRRKRNKKGENSDTQAQATSAATYDPNKQQQSAQQPTTLAISNLASNTTSNASGTTQYAQFMTTPTGYSHLQSDPYGTLTVPQTAIIYLQTSPTSGNAVQLSSNDMSTLNQLIGYTDINSLNGQLTMAPGHPQVQATYASSQSAQQQVSGQTNGLTSICLDGTNGQTTTLAFVADQASSGVYKCDYPLCYYQSDQYEAMLIHKHRDHPIQQLPSPSGQHGQQQITIIDASQLPQLTSVTNPGEQHHHGSQSHQVQHHQLVTSSPSDHVSSASSVYALTTSNSSNYVHALDYHSITTTSGHSQLSTSSTLGQHQSHDGHSSNMPVSSHALNNNSANNLLTTNMIFASDPNALFSYSQPQVVHTMNGTVTSTPSSINSPPSSMSSSSVGSSLVAAAVASAGLTETSLSGAITSVAN